MSECLAFYIIIYTAPYADDKMLNILHFIVYFMTVFFSFANQPVFAAQSESPPAPRRERYSPSTWPAAAAEKAAADRSAR